MAEYIIRDNEDARRAFHGVARELKVSVTALAESAGLSSGSVNRFVFERLHMKSGVRSKTSNIHLLTLLRVMDNAGYEVVVRPKVPGSRRERRLAALKERGDGARNAVQPAVRPDPS